MDDQSRLLWTFLAIAVFGVFAWIAHRRRTAASRGAPRRYAPMLGHLMVIVAAALVMALTVFFFGPQT